jgi:hypothetical protein
MAVYSVRGDTTRLVFTRVLPRKFTTVFGDLFASNLHSFRKLLGSYHLQCDEIYPTCSNCKRLETSCSLSTPNSPTDSDIVEKQLNIEDLQLLNDWHMGKKDTRFSDHIEEDSFREQRGREIELGFKHPYGQLIPIKPLPRFHLQS